MNNNTPNKATVTKTCQWLVVFQTVLPKSKGTQKYHVRRFYIGKR